MDESAPYLLVLTTCPDADRAEALARGLVEAGLAACVNVVPAVRSFYRWQGRLESATECLVVAKSRRDRYAELERAIRASHPYALPEVLAVPVAAGLAEYLAWVDDCVRPSR